jgi:hypothetical protein
LGSIREIILDGKAAVEMFSNEVMGADNEKIGSDVDSAIKVLVPVWRRLLALRMTDFEVAGMF